VFGLDDAIAGLGGGNSIGLSLLVALLLGLRHASDPDHVAALSTLAAGDRAGPRAGAVLGLCWGTGHALTLTAFGLPVILLRSSFPDRLYQVAEIAVGVMIMALAARLWLRWRRGRLHLHEHRHPGGVRHAHVHSHLEGPAHVHTNRARTPLGAFAIGLVHGTGGSAGVTVLLLAAVPSRLVAAASLIVLAAGTAISMCVISSGLGAVLVSGPVRRGFHQLAPALAVASFAFGAWYGLAGLDLL
jgi:hypothetical protein